MPKIPNLPKIPTLYFEKKSMNILRGIGVVRITTNDSKGISKGRESHSDHIVIS